MNNNLLEMNLFGCKFLQGKRLQLNKSLLFSKHQSVLNDILNKFGDILKSGHFS